MNSKSSISILAKAISSRKGLTQAEAERFIGKMFEVANQGLQDDKLLKMKWLGTFKVTAVKDRESVDVNTGERILIEGRDKINFTPDAILKEIINKPFAQFETVVVNDGVDFSDIDEKFSHVSDVEDSREEMIQPTPVADSESLVSQTPETEKLPEEASKPINEPVHVFGGDENTEQVSDSVELIEDTPTPLAEQVTQEEQTQPANIEETVKPSDLESATEKDTETSDEEEDSLRNHHFVIPKYVVAVACSLFVLLAGGMAWLAFSYGKMAAQQDHLMTQINDFKKKEANTMTARPASTTSTENSQDEMLMKAKEDSIRMAKTSEAVKLAEEAEKKQVQQDKVSETKKETPISKEETKKKQESETSHFDSDARVRTGAYRIVGVAQTITVKPGQTLSSISKLYLGPGMECYVEAVNGSMTEAKVGQKIKIPKLELKKRK